MPRGARSRCRIETDPLVRVGDHGPEHRVYYSGDTAMFPELADIGERLGPFDAALIETGAYNRSWVDVHMGPEQAIVAHELVRGGLFIPVHWGTFDLAVHNWTEPVERALAAAELTGVKVAVPRPGESIVPRRGRPLSNAGGRTSRGKPRAM